MPLLKDGANNDTDFDQTFIQKFSVIMEPSAQMELVKSSSY